MLSGIVDPAVEVEKCTAVEGETAGGVIFSNRERSAR